MLESLLNKVSALLNFTNSILLKRDSKTGVSCNYCEILKNSFLWIISGTPPRPRPATLLKKSLWHRYFTMNFAKFIRTPFLQNTSGRLLLTFKRLKNGRFVHPTPQIWLKSAFFVNNLEIWRSKAILIDNLTNSFDPIIFFCSRQNRVLSGPN